MLKKLRMSTVIKVGFCHYEKCSKSSLVLFLPDAIEKSKYLMEFHIVANLNGSMGWRQ